MEPYSSDSYVPWLCYAVMLRSIDIPRSYFCSAPLFLYLSVFELSRRHLLGHHFPWENGGLEPTTVSKALASWNCPMLLALECFLDHSPRSKRASNGQCHGFGILTLLLALLPSRVLLATLIYTYTHLTNTSLPLCCMCIISLTRDKAGFEPLNGGDSWRPRRV